MIVCNCLAVSDSTIRDLVERGIADVEGVAGACGAGTDCGSCRGVLDAMVASETSVTLARAS